MPNAPEPKRPDNDDTIGLILGAIIGFVLFTLLGRLIRRPILLTVVVASLFGLYQYSQHLLQQDLQLVTIQTVGSGRDCGDVRSIPVRINNGDTRSITSFRFIATATQPTHDHEPGCAVLRAATNGTLDPARLGRWRKLTAENSSNTLILSGPRGNKNTRTPGKGR